MTLYSEANKYRTYDKVLWDHYRGGTGRKLFLLITAFDPSGQDRQDLLLHTWNRWKNRPNNANDLDCNDSVYIGTRRGSLEFTNESTQMISDYNMDVEVEFQVSKTCLFGRCVCWINWLASFEAYDRTDFNPGEQFGFVHPDTGVGIVITDNLILSCLIGTPFDIQASHQQSGSWLTSCNDL